MTTELEAVLTGGRNTFAQWENGDASEAQVAGALWALIDALSTPPADDVREALAAARNVELYLDMLALDVDDPVHVVIDDGYDSAGVIQSLEVPDLRTLVAFAREVRPGGTVTDAEVEAGAQALFEDPAYDPEYTWAQMVVEDASRADIWRADARRILEAARGVRS